MRRRPGTCRALALAGSLHVLVGAGGCAFRSPPAEGRASFDADSLPPIEWPARRTGDLDAVVPADSGDLLYERLGRPERWTFPGGHGLVFWLLPAHADDIVDWIDSHVGPGRRDVNGVESPMGGQETVDRIEWLAGAAARPSSTPGARHFPIRSQETLHVAKQAEGLVASVRRSVQAAARHAR